MTDKTVTIPVKYGADSPADKAARVADIVRAYGEAVDNGEHKFTVVSDLIADLLHYVDLLPADEVPDHRQPGAESVIDAALDYYAYEANA